MAIRIRLKTPPQLPVDVSGVCARPSRQNSDSLSAAGIRVGNQLVELGQVFSVSGRADVEGTAVWEGTTPNVHGIAAGLTAGKVLIEGEAGCYSGALMSGGELSVTGNAGLRVGAAMRGGIIRVGGDVEGEAGGPLPGQTAGMSGGAILIAGDVGQLTGLSMCGGLIAVRGLAAGLAGYQMRRGTILLCDDCGSNVGVGLVRGTICLLAGGINKLAPAFLPACRQTPVVLRLLAAHLATMGFPIELPQQELLIFNGDLLHGGRGEILLASP